MVLEIRVRTAGTMRWCDLDRYMHAQTAMQGFCNEPQTHPPSWSQVGEMKAFKDHVIQLHKELSEARAKVAVALEGMGSVLAQELPSAHEHSEAGVVQPSNSEKHLVSLFMFV